MDALIAAAKKEADPAKRAELYKELQELTHEDAPYIWIAQNINVTVLNENVGGYFYNPALQIKFETLYFKS